MDRTTEYYTGLKSYCAFLRIKCIKIIAPGISENVSVGPYPMAGKLFASYTDYLGLIPGIVGL